MMYYLFLLFASSAFLWICCKANKDGEPERTIAPVAGIVALATGSILPIYSFFILVPREKLLWIGLLCFPIAIIAISIAGLAFGKNTRLLKIIWVTCITLALAAILGVSGFV